MISFHAFLASAVVPVAESEGPLAKITRDFHVEWPQVIAQCISFIIVCILLWKFAFGPIQKILEERRARIANGEEKLKLIERQLADSVQTTAAAISKANDEAVRMVTEAKQGAATFTEQKAQEAISSAQQILARAEAAAKAEHERLTAELKREFGRLVIATTSQVTGKVLTGDDQRRINEDALATVEA
jgi:F-type H+-transporting ATPase subunit b